jgi:hypothetical protein
MLNIAVIAYYYELSCKAIRELAENDTNSKPKIIRKDTIIMEDGTEYKAFSTYENARGRRIDQLILVNIYEFNESLHKLYEYITYRIYCTSCVPEEYQIQNYKW